MFIRKKHYLQEYPQLNQGCHYHFEDTKKVWDFIHSGKKSDPITISLIAIGAGTALSVVSDVREGQVASAGAKYNAQVAEQQAGAYQTAAALEEKQYQTAAELEAKQLETQGKVEQAKMVREKAQMQSAQRARYGKGGVIIDEGSPLEVLSDTAAQYELDLSASRYNVEIAQKRLDYDTRMSIERLRYGTAVGVARSKSEAAYQGLLAKEYKTSGYLKGAGTLLTGLGTMGALGFGSTGSGVIQGGKGGTTSMTKQFGKVWSPY